MASGSVISAAELRENIINHPEVRQGEGDLEPPLASSN